jgi:hypothetical protein
MYTHYGSTNETYKIAYEKQALTPRARLYELCQVRKLPGSKEAAHGMFGLWFLQREKGFKFSSQAGKEAEEGKG